MVKFNKKSAPNGLPNTQTCQKKEQNMNNQELIPNSPLTDAEVMFFLKISKILTISETDTHNPTPTLNAQYYKNAAINLNIVQQSNLRPFTNAQLATLGDKNLRETTQKHPINYNEVATELNTYSAL